MHPAGISSSRVSHTIENDAHELRLSRFLIACFYVDDQRLYHIRHHPLVKRILLHFLEAIHFHLYLHRGGQAIIYGLLYKSTGIQRRRKSDRLQVSHDAALHDVAPHDLRAIFGDQVPILPQKVQSHRVMTHPGRKPLLQKDAAFIFPIIGIEKSIQCAAELRPIIQVQKAKDELHHPQGIAIRHQNVRQISKLLAAQFLPFAFAFMKEALHFDKKRL